jgi:hypothetical protein
MWPAAAGPTLKARERKWLLRRALNTRLEGGKS